MYARYPSAGGTGNDLEPSLSLRQRLIFVSGHASTALTLPSFDNVNTISNGLASGSLVAWKHACMRGALFCSKCFERTWSYARPAGVCRLAWASATALAKRSLGVGSAARLKNTVIATAATAAIGFMTSLLH